MKESGKKLVRKEKELEALYNVIALVTQGGNLRTIYSRIAATVSKYTRFPVVAIERYVPDEDILEIVGHTGLLPEGKGTILRVPVEESLSGRVIRSRKSAVKPMTLDEATLEMEGRGNEVFVFRDAATERVTVLFRRRDGNLGLLEPEA